MKHELAVLAAHEIDVVSGGWCGSVPLRFRFPPPPQPDPYLQILTSPVVNQLSAGATMPAAPTAGLATIG